MPLSKCNTPRKLIPFLKKDYANNLYFFTYLNDDTENPDVNFYTLENNGKVELVLMVTPVHCCVSTTSIQQLFVINNQLPPINSIHVVGRRDYVEALLSLSNGPERSRHLYYLSRLDPDAGIGLRPEPEVQRASIENLSELTDFYNNNDMLFGADKRLPGMLSWGRVYFVKEENRIVSCALTTTEIDDAAMIGAVYTIPQYRRRGHARNCITRFCQDLLADGKSSYLFYDTENELLDQMYKSLGFQPVETWMLASKL